MRITEGHTENGESLRRVDDWTQPLESHCLMPSLWIDTTTFYVDYVEDASLGGDCRRQRDRASESSASHRAASNSNINTRSVPKQSKFVWADATDSDDCTSDGEAP